MLNYTIAKQMGVALITALLIVALVTITAVAMLSQQQLDIRRTANVLNYDQAYLYTLGGETWAKRILLRDLQHSKTDSLQELWAMPLPATVVAGGSIQGHIQDLQGRFNLNNLIKEGKVSAEDVAFFERLLILLNLSPDLSQAVIDWLDSNTDPELPNGAEDEIYLLQEPAYRAANRQLQSPSELRLIAGFDQETYVKLLPYITTLPTHTSLNINTTSALLFMALVEELSQMEADRLIAARDRQPYENISDFLQQDSLAGLILQPISLSTSSDYFLCITQAEIAPIQLKLNSILYREPQKITLIMRSQHTL